MFLADRAGFEPAADFRQEINSLPPATTRVPTNKNIKNPVSLKGLTGFSLKIHLAMKQN